MPRLLDAVLEALDLFNPLLAERVFGWVIIRCIDKL
jgi:hypothetical protein